MTVGPRTYSSPTSPCGRTEPSSPTANVSTPVIALPIGIESVGSSAHRGTSYQVHTFVSVGPKRFAKRARGRICISRRRYFVGNTSPAKRTVRRAGSSASCRRPRSTSNVRIDGTEYQIVIPVSPNPRGELDREERQLLRDEHDRRAGLRGGEQVEDREVEVKRRVAREAVLLRDAELLGRPVHEATSRSDGRA